MPSQPKVEYISLAEAAKLSPYSKEYLGLRARQGKLKAVRIGRNWATTKSWLKQYVQSAEESKSGTSEIKFVNAKLQQETQPLKLPAQIPGVAVPSPIEISLPVKGIFKSLKEAAKLTPYSKEYLGLRARQGKLKALKVGKNWFTTKEWLDLYIKESEDFKNALRETAFGRMKYVATPANLPILQRPGLGLRFELGLRPGLDRTLQVFKLTGAFALVLLFTVVIHGLDLGTKTENVILQTPNYVKDFSQGFDRGVQKLALKTHDAVQGFGNGFNTGLPTAIASLPDFARQANESVQSFSSGFSAGLANPASVETLANDYAQWLGEQVISLPEAYTSLDQKISEGLKNDAQAFTQGYENLNHKVTQGIRNNVTSLARLSSEKLSLAKDVVGNALSNTVGGIKARIARVSEEPRPQPEPETMPEAGPQEEAGPSQEAELQKEAGLQAEESAE